MKRQGQFLLQSIALIGFILLFGFNSARAEYKDSEFFKAEEQAIDRLSAEWAKQINARDPAKIVALYNDPFILYATFKTKIDTQAGLLQYFTDLTKKKDLKVVFTEQNIRCGGHVAVNSGLYTFSYTDDGKTEKVPARFTFVYTLTSTGWKIVDHHSSELPD